MPRKKKAVLVKISRVISVALGALSLGAASFIAGYSLAFSKLANVYAQTCVLKAKAAELEDQILRLRNYAVLIDVLSTQGQAANELARLPQPSTKNNSLPNAKEGEAPSSQGASPE